MRRQKKTTFTTRDSLVDDNLMIDYLDVSRPEYLSRSSKMIAELG